MDNLPKYFIFYWDACPYWMKTDRPGEWKKSGNSLINKIGWDDINRAYAEIAHYKRSSLLKYIVIDDVSIIKSLPPPSW